MGKSALPAHGTVRRYRLELKDAGACEKCRAANSRAKATERANRKARDQRSHMAIVPDPQDAPTDVGTNDTADDDAPPAPGEMEKAVTEDLDAIVSAERVQFHRSLSALALQLAREVDGTTSAVARSAASRQLFEVLKSLRSGKDSDDPSALDLYLDEFGVPLVPGGAA